MSDRRVVLITQGGPETTAAVDLLTEWARYGLIHPFVSCAGDTQGAYVDIRGRGEPSSVFEILAPQDLELVRVVALSGPADGGTGGTSEMARRLKALAPEGLRVLEGRIWVAPGPDGDNGETRWSRAEDFFAPEADANLVLIPEDRQTEAKLAIPLTHEGSDRFAAHVATEVATALGMWSGMSEAPVDGMKGGTIGYGDAKVHLVRSFVRIAEIPAVTLSGATDHGGVLRVPSGAREAPYPRQATVSVQKRIESILRDRLVREASVDRPERVGMRQFLRVMARGTRDALRYLFTFSKDVVDAIRDTTGRIMQEAVGHDSVLRVVWRGMPSDVEEAPRTVDPEELMQSIRSRRMLEGGVLIDQQLWADMGKAVFASTDGGQMPEGMDPLKIKGRVVIVKEVGMITPDYGPTLADEIRADADESVPATLLGRLGSYIRRIERRSRRDFARLVEQSKRVIDVERIPALTLPGVVTTLLVTLAAVGLLLLTGFVDLVGITVMGRVARAWAWGGVTAVYALGLVLVTRTVAARHRSELPLTNGSEASALGDSGTEETDVKADERGLVAQIETAREVPSRLPGFMGALTAAILAGLAAWFGALVSGLFRTDAVAFGVSVALAVYASALAVVLDRKLPRSMESFRQVRMLAFFTMIYVAFGLVGLTARDSGWYGDRRPQGFVDLWIAEGVVALLIILLVAAMAFDSFRREKRARVRISDIERGITASVDTQWAAEEAFEQFVASAAAWAGIIWKPFGEVVDTDPVQRDSTAFDVLKAEARPFLLTPLGAMAMRERMMRELAKPGWLGQRYEAAVDAYRRRRAIETGEDPAAVLRPDQDPREVRTVRPDQRSEVSGRWRFVQDLLAGTYDRDLSRALAMSDYAQAAEWTFQREGTLEASEIGGEPLDRYLGAIVSKVDSEVSYIYFDHDSLPNAERSLKADLWWPSKLIDSPAGQAARTTSVSRLVNGDLAIMSVRHDSAGPYVAGDLFSKLPSADEDSDYEDSEPGEKPTL